MDYTNELKRLRQGDGLVFRKTEREVKAAIAARVEEIRASMAAHARKLSEFAAQQGISARDVEAIIQKAKDLRDPLDIDVISYEPSLGVVLALALVHRIEDDWISSLNFVAQNVTGEMELSFSAFQMFFGSYTPHTVEREVSLKRAEQRLREYAEAVQAASEPRPVAHKHRRRLQEEEFDLNHFLSSEY